MALLFVQDELWLSGVPWYFNFALLQVKVPLATISGMLVDFPCCSKRIGDVRFFMLFWMLFWFLPFSLMGGKFTRSLPVGSWSRNLSLPQLESGYLTAWLARRVSSWRVKSHSQTSNDSDDVMGPSISRGARVSADYRLYMIQLEVSKGGLLFPAR